jgi:hypothetical protein
MPFRDPRASQAEMAARLGAAIDDGRRVVAALEEQETTLARRLNSLWNQLARRMAFVALLAIVVGGGIPLLYKAVTGHPVYPGLPCDDGTASRIAARR